MIIELHLLQSFPVSNLNRDDLGQPKSAVFGGHTRGRISSQSIKRSARLLFNSHGLGESETGIRTKRLRDKVAEALVTLGCDAEQAPIVVETGLRQLGFGVDPATGLTEYLLFVGSTAIDHLTSYCQKNWEQLAAIANTAATTRGKPAKIKPDKAALAEAHRVLDASRAVDVALFGRMIADNKDFNVDAASQVAHALSTHAVVNEFDFFTAVDDLKPDSESGADMIGTVDFNSACYYRYANLDTEQLATNLSGDMDLTQRAVSAWLHAFIHAVPGGMQNTTAARTMPETLLGVVRERGAWNLANAFLSPVTGTDLMSGSTDRLTKHFVQLRSFYGGGEIRVVAAAAVTGHIQHLDEADVASNLDAFTSRLLTAARA